MKVGSLDSVITSLSSDEDVLGSISSSDVGFFSSGELFHGLYGMVVCVLCSHSVLCCLWRRPQYSDDHRSGKIFQLCPHFCMWSIETFKKVAHPISR